MFGLLIAIAAGARTIITSSSDAKLEMAKKMGATHTINYRATPEWDVEVKRWTNGVGAQHVLDNVGLNEIERCFGAVATGGVVTCVGGLGGKPTAVVNIPMLAILKQATLRCVSPSRVVHHLSRSNCDVLSGVIVGSKQLFEELLRFAEVNQIRPYVHRTFALDKAVEALRYLESGEHFGKVVIHVVPH